MSIFEPVDLTSTKKGEIKCPFRRIFARCKSQLEINGMIEHLLDKPLTRPCPRTCKQMPVNKLILHKRGLIVKAIAQIGDFDVDRLDQRPAFAVLEFLDYMSRSLAAKTQYIFKRIHQPGLQLAHAAIYFSHGMRIFTQFGSVRDYPFVAQQINETCAQFRKRGVTSVISSGWLVVASIDQALANFRSSSLWQMIAVTPPSASS